jgi:hypothetical protein
MPRDVSHVASSHGLAAFVAALRDEHRANPQAWENSDLDSFLEALAAWIEDSPAYWRNQGEREPPQPDWSWVALSLRAATGYE